MSVDTGRSRPEPPTSAMAGRLRTVSLRRRVMLFSLAVLGLVLVLVSALSLVFFGIQSRAELTRRMADSAALANQLAGQRVPPDRIVAQIGSPSVVVRLVTPDGLVYGSRFATPRPSPRTTADRDRDGDSDDWAARPGPGEHRGAADRVLRRTLVDGSRLALHGDADELTAVQRRLSRLLVLLGVSGLVAAALALLATTRVALRPLDAMTSLARSIAAGDRGRRLAPTRTDTELGRTAAAFDGMLDALEGAERQARQAETTARESEARTRRFVADAAHELRTPIAGLRAAAEAALRSQATGEERDWLHLLLIREAGRAGRLVEDLLAMARIDAGLRLVREPVQLRELAEAEADRIRLLSPTLTVQVTGESLTVSGDAQRLAQVLGNLLDNARRYTPDGGAVSINVDHQPGDAALARVRVADSGPGVPPADRERIFDRLVRLDDARGRDTGTPGHGGAGLGLAIARGIARAHGGDLRCVRDSVFELTLPVDGPADDDRDE